MRDWANNFDDHGSQSRSWISERFRQVGRSDGGQGPSNDADGHGCPQPLEWTSYGVTNTRVDRLSVRERIWRAQVRPGLGRRFGELKVTAKIESPDTIVVRAVQLVFYPSSRRKDIISDEGETHLDEGSSENKRRRRTNGRDTLQRYGPVCAVAVAVASEIKGTLEDPKKVVGKDTSPVTGPLAVSTLPAPVLV